MIQEQNTLFSRILIEELVRLGVRLFVISPGARSTPLATAVADRDDVQSIVHFDERGAAFVALGYARANNKPAALICTSGTAGANYYPAVIEATVSGLPMFVLTADRPEALHGISANQTIDQTDLFGIYANSCTFEVSADGFDTELLLETLDSLYRNLSASPIAHVNCQFDKPLEPTDVELKALLPAHLSDWHDSGRPYTVPEDESVPTETPSEIIDVINSAERGVVLVGRLRSEDERAAAMKIAEHLQWPILADVTSGLRFTDSKLVIHHSDLIALAHGGSEQLSTDCVLYLGAELVSERLQKFLADSSPSAFVHVEDTEIERDPLGLVTDQVRIPIAKFAEQILQAITGSENVSGLEAWQHAGRKVARLIDELPTDSLCEPVVAHQLALALAPQSDLFIGNSMPIRDINSFVNGKQTDIRVGVNRGVSGIDGTLATACGFSFGDSRPLVVYLGDLTCLHDLNSLSLLGQMASPVAIVVINNSGGGIFDHLPIAERWPKYRREISAPHALTFRNAASMFGFEYELVEESHQLRSALAHVGNNQSHLMIEIKVDRSRNLETYKRLKNAIILTLG